MSDRDREVLLIEDNPGDARLIREMLAEVKSTRFAVRCVDCLSKGLECLAEGGIDVVLLDLTLPDSRGVDSVVGLHDQAPDVPIVALTGLDDETLALEAVGRGAQDYLVKGRADGNLLSRAVSYAIERKRAEDMLRKSHDRLRNLAARLHAVREDERARIAREIHDELGQEITGLKLNLCWLTEKIPENEKEARKRARLMASQLDQAIETVRRITSELRPAVLDDLGLDAAVEWQAREFESRSGCRCVLDCDLGQLGPDRDRDMTAFRILQEALTNVARHAEASCVRIGLRPLGGNLVLEVSDDGKGISEEALADSRSLGLVGMRERAWALGGRIEIRQGVNGGTVVSLQMPLASQRGQVWRRDNNPNSPRRPERHDR